MFDPRGGASWALALAAGAWTLAVPGRVPPGATVAPAPAGGSPVRIVAPGEGELVVGRVEIRAEVDPAVAERVAYVEFWVDGRLLFADAHAPFELVWHAREPAPHRIEARAWTADGEFFSHAVRTAPPPPVRGAAAFRARVERVELYVSVEDRKHRRVRLEADDFIVLEQDSPQPILEVARSADLPLAVGLLVDCSGSMLERLTTALEAAGSFIEGLMTQGRDKAFLMSFADTPTLLQEFTNDVDRLEGALELVEGGRDTRLYDAIVTASARFDGQDGRRALVVLTDGHDARSDTNLEGAIRAAQRADVALYPVAVGLSSRYFHERWVLGRMADATGGRLLALEPRDDPERVYRAIAQDLRTQYRITYRPLRPGGDGEWRRVEVRLRSDSGHEHARLRSRPGYFAE